MANLWVESDPSLFFSKNDPTDPRLGDFAKALNSKKLSKISDGFFIWGYPDDEGILLNGGRVGASVAPTEIRKYFYKMTPPAFVSATLPIHDLGNLVTSMKLSERHSEGAHLSETLAAKNLHWLSLGGGHDYGYADGSGFLRSMLNKNFRPVVINIDAHLDVRPTDKGLNSGTPFRRLIEEFKGKFDFYELGIQSQCNSKYHLEWLKQNGGTIISLDDIRKSGILHALNLIKVKSQICSKTPIWLSLDIDGLTSNEAPGCSQSWTTGLTTLEVLEMFHWLNENSRWRGLSIYEVSPPLDSDNRTSKLAALLAHRFYEIATQSQGKG